MEKQCINLFGLKILFKYISFWKNESFIEMQIAVSKVDSAPLQITFTFISIWINASLVVGKVCQVDKGLQANCAY